MPRKPTIVQLKAACYRATHEELRFNSEERRREGAVSTAFRNGFNPFIPGHSKINWNDPIFQDTLFDEMERHNDITQELENRKRLVKEAWDNLYSRLGTTRERFPHEVVEQMQQAKAQRPKQKRQLRSFGWR